MKTMRNAGYGIVWSVLGITGHSLIPSGAHYWIAVAALVLLVIMFTFDSIVAKRASAKLRKGSVKRKRRNRPPRKRKRKK
jgi:hypothetical protein